MNLSLFSNTLFLFNESIKVIEKEEFDDKWDSMKGFIYPKKKKQMDRGRQKNRKY